MSQQPFMHLHDPPKHCNINWFISSRQPICIIIMLITTIISSSWMPLSDVIVFCFFVFNGKAPEEVCQE